jgi:hypothetical protein
MTKRVTLLLIVISIVSSLILAKAAPASASTPAVPEFTLEYVDYSYDVPPATTSTTDPYTNETTTTTVPGYHVENKIWEATIKNNIGASYYNFRYKGHYEEEWSYYPSDPDSIRGYNHYDAFSVPCQASDSDYTVISLTFLPKSIPEGGQVDIQVQALFGNYDAVPYGHIQPMPAPTYDFYFNGTTSDWSATQTITFGESQASTPSPAITPTPTPTTAPSPIPVPDQSYFFVESNSTVSELFFNSTSGELSFTVTGETGTPGYVEITIAKSLVSNIQDVKVYLDGSQLAVVITEDGDSWLLRFTYTHSTHQVKVSLATDLDAPLIGVESWVWIASAILVGILSAVAVASMYKRRRR